jgi:hypothetical protein
LICSQGQKLKLKSKNYKQRSQVYNVYQCHVCGDCPVKAKCTTSKTGRRVKLNKSHDWIGKYKERLNDKSAKKLIRQRKSIVEHPFGALKLFMGKYCFILTEKCKIQIEADLYTPVYNIKRLLNVSSFNQSMNQIAEYNWKIAYLEIRVKFFLIQKTVNIYESIKNVFSHSLLNPALPVLKPYGFFKT